MAKLKHWTEELLSRVLPIWRGQIEFAVKHMEESIVGLSAKFSNVVHSLNLMHKVAGQERDGLREQAEDVKSVLAQLKQDMGSAKDKRNLQLLQQLELKISALTDAYESRANENLRATQGIKDQVEEILVDLQFQDRVSQMLRSVVITQQQLSDALVDAGKAKGSSKDGKVDFDTEKWIEGMRESYAMEDQYRIHDGNVKAESKQVDEITFF